MKLSLATALLFVFTLTAAAQQPGESVDVRVVAALSAPSVYVGERVLLTYRILTRDFLSRIEVRDQPQYAGFWVKELSESAPGRRPGPVGGGLYDVAAKRVLLYPTVPGRLRIAPLTLSIRAYPPSSLNLIAPPVTILRSSQPLMLEVRPLPPPPAGGPPFTGAVGQFSLAASLQPSRISVGETAEMEIRVRGNGNTDALVMPTLPESEGLKFYAKRVETQGPAPESPDGPGEATWRVTVAANRAGSYQLPLAFTYFDPRAREYRTAHATLLALEVEASHAESESPATDGSNAPRGDSLAQSSTPAITLIKLLGYGLIGAGLLIAIFLAARRFGMLASAAPRQSSPEDGPPGADEQLTERIEGCLAGASQAAQIGDRKRFLTELAQALGAVFEVEFGLTPAELTTEVIAARLRERGQRDELARAAAESFSRLEAMRFNPQTEGLIEQQELGRVRRLITELTVENKAVGGRH
jgi:hypothetical protein